MTHMYVMFQLSLRKSIWKGEKSVAGGAGGEGYAENCRNVYYINRANKSNAFFPWIKDFAFLERKWCRYRKEMYSLHLFL